MIQAPFSAAEAGSALASLGAVFLAIAGLMLILGTRRQPTRRALALGATIALLAGLAGHVFR